MAAALACTACGKDAAKRGDKRDQGEPAAAPALDPQAVKRFTDDFDHPLVGVGPEAPAAKILAALKAALAEAPEVGLVMFEAPPGGGRVAGKGEAGHKGYRMICKLTQAPPPPARDSPEDSPPRLSVLVQPDAVWFAVSRVGDLIKVSITPTLQDQVRDVAAQMAQESWFVVDRHAEIAAEGGVSGGTVIAVIEGMCSDFAAFRIVAPEALTTRPEL